MRCCVVIDTSRTSRLNPNSEPAPTFGQSSSGEWARPIDRPQVTPSTARHSARTSCSGRFRFPFRCIPQGGVSSASARATAKGDRRVLQGTAVTAVLPDGTNLRTISDKFGDTEALAAEEGLSNVALYIECPTIARNDIIAFLGLETLV